MASEKGTVKGISCSIQDTMRILALPERPEPNSTRAPRVFHPISRAFSVLDAIDPALPDQIGSL